ncbi:GNAT family N-acetyltransferase [Ferrimonas balearica]|uniref:GNAT family N-acetyltransferase n=1 Tax=Ferrimonas balearica TaxID=44012 RepID=UPI001C995ED2|nr:GNAT family N-acetyltransferase [Ferrimonas balearica]MBY5992220.1 GNAT family N-acetyltransferase [Ferrimonas balearica]
MKIENALPEHYAEMLAVWEDSVRATHDFISEADIAFFKPVILEHGFPNVTLKIALSDQGRILGFIGTAEQRIEMLFVLNAARGQGIGKRLLQLAMKQLGATQVDVNEQNPQAVGFYQRMGFKVVSRSPTDSMGKPFPILHLSL